MQHPLPGDIVEIHVVPDSIFRPVKVIEWEDDWVRVSEAQTTPAGTIDVVYTIRVEHIIRYTVSVTVSAQEKNRPAQYVSPAPQKALVDVEAELVEKVKSLAELRVEQKATKMASIRDFLPDNLLNKRRHITSTEKYELPSFKKHTKDET